MTYRRFVAVVIRWMPTGIPLGFLFVGLSFFYSQNRNSFVRQGDFTIVAECELNRQFRKDTSDVSNDGESNPAILSELPPRLIAKKYLFVRCAGLRLFDRGYNSRFSAEIPDFVDANPFLKRVQQQLQREYELSAADFAKFDWSLVIEGLEDNTHYLRDWESVVSIEFIHKTHEAVSLLESHWEYTGGAHGNSLNVGRNFVGQSGQVRQLNLSDLFDPSCGWQHRLIAICLNDLRDQGASSVPIMDAADSDLPGFTVADLESFSLSSTGLRFYFSPYHVGCYAEGAYSVFIPYATIRELIPADSPIQRFMDVDFQ